MAQTHEAQHTLDKLAGAVTQAAGNGSSAAALKTIAEALGTMPTAAFETWPSSVREGWQEAVERIFEDLTRKTVTEAHDGVVFEGVRVGIDHPLLRDYMGVLSRRHFPEYLDPAGMIEAVAMFNDSVAMRDVWRRWEIFSAFQVGRICFHDVYGQGEILEIDSEIDEITIRFTRPVSFDATAAVESLVFLRPDSALDRVVRGDLPPAEARQLDEAELRRGLLAIVPEVDYVLRRLLGDDYGKSKKLTKKRIVAETATGQRDWFEARSLIEMVELLRGTKEAGTAAGAPQLVRELWAPAVAREDQAEMFAESAARLWALFRKEEWLQELLVGLRDETLCWQDDDLFVSITDGISGRLLQPWLSAGLATLGADRLAELGVGLPLRLWSTLQRVLETVEGGGDTLLRHAIAKLESTDPSADAAMWLWKSKCTDKSILASANLVFRILARTVTGSHHKAARDLRKHLLENDDFQRFVVRGGEDEAVLSLVRCARGLSVLNSGEQQSLLVRIVRLFPEAIRLVEQRQTKITKKEMPRVTSFRSFVKRQKELEDIINVKIPANSRAIAHARSYGDLRENAEYKAAKEEQGYLTARRSELEKALSTTQPTDFHEVEIDDIVVPGSTIELEYMDGRRQTFYLLGLWDSDPSESHISYETPMGRVLMGMAVGDSVIVPSGDEASIASVKKLPAELIAALTEDA